MNFAFSLTVESGPAMGQQMPVGADGLTVGRQAGNSLVLDDEQVSRQHARFDLRDGGLLVTDLGSANGTTVNGARIVGARPLRPGDLVLIGATALRVVGVAPAGAAPDVATAAHFGATPAPPPPAARRPTSAPLIVGAAVAALLLCCLCSGLVFAIVVSRADGDGDGGSSGSVGSGIPTAVGGSGEPLPGGAAPAPAGGAGVPRGDYLCQSFAGSAVGLVTVGGLHILSDTAVSYSTDEKPVTGAPRYTYRYNPATRAITFEGGPYDGRQGTYDPDRKVIQVSYSVSCSWRR